MIEVSFVVSEFYGISLVDALKAVDPFLKSHEKWERDFRSYKEAYVKNLARAVFDYTVLACAGEARHARACTGYYNPYIPQGGGRGSAMEYAKRYEPYSVLRACYRLFNELDWGSNYGGEAWARIAHAGLQYGKWDDVTFIDHCVDLSHNSSPYFDKCQAGIFEMCSSSRYEELLDMKRSYAPEDLIYELFLSTKLQALIERACNLGILPEFMRAFRERSKSTQADIDYCVKLVLEYSPVSWGEAILPDEIVEDQEEEEEEEEYEYEQEEEEQEEAYGEDFEEQLGNYEPANNDSRN